MKSVWLWFVLLSMPALANSLDPGQSIDADNPFARSLEGASEDPVDPAALRARLLELERISQLESDTREVADERLLSDEEFKDMQRVLQALQAPAPRADALDESTVPALAKPVSDYRLRGVMVSFAQNPTVNREFARTDQEKRPETIHVLQGRETLDSIAALYGSSVELIAKANGFAPTRSLSAGIAILVPLPEQSDQTIAIKEYFLQLGAYSSDPRAREAISDFTVKHAALLGAERFRVTPPLEGDRELWRVSVGPFESEALAENKCTLLKAEGTSCLVREEVTEEKQDRKAPVQLGPTYVAVLSDGTSDEEIIVSEGDRLGNGGGIVVSIFENRLIVQEGGSQRVLSLSQEAAPEPVQPPPQPVVTPPPQDEAS